HACGENGRPPRTREPVRTVHPHACGENLPSRFCAWLFSGPPPRVWGKHGVLPANRQDQRSTPTRVGKTLATPVFYQILPVHPHACGENPFDRRSRPSPSGPPPRVWGKRERRRQHRIRHRSTPTRVGKTAMPIEKEP